MSNAEGGSAQFFGHPLGDFRHSLEEILKTPLFEIINVYVFSPDGAIYRLNFDFMNDLICGQAAPGVLVRRWNSL